MTETILHVGSLKIELNQGVLIASVRGVPFGVKAIEHTDPGEITLGDLSHLFDNEDEILD